MQARLCVHEIQSAVDHSGRGATIDVKPGTYVEGVIVSGHSHDGLRIIGLGKKPDAVLLEGQQRPRSGGRSLRTAIEGDNVNNLVLENMKAEHFAANGFFINACHGFLMKNLIAGFDRAYGLVRVQVRGGRMTQSIGYGHGDSAFYVGGTPPQKHPQTTTLDHLTAYENVFGFSGSNAKYMVIRDSEFYDNGAGLIPNTWKPEPFEPASDGVIEHNLIYWNNFDYFRPGLPGHDQRPRRQGPGSQLPHRGRRSAVRGQAVDGQEQFDLRQLPVGRGGLLGSDQ